MPGRNNKMEEQFTYAEMYVNAHAGLKIGNHFEVNRRNKDWQQKGSTVKYQHKASTTIDDVQVGEGK